MYELLLKIDSKLGQRYKTIETNIKAKSNSFYESLLALLEGLARLIANKEKIEIDSEYDTLIGILRVKDFKKYCLKIGVSDEEYEKLFSIAKTVNSHKHDSETKVTLEIVLEYLQATFNFVKPYYIAKFKKCDVKFNSKEISDLYGLTEKEIKKLEEEKAKLEESLLKSSNASEMLASDLQRVKEIQKAKEREYASFDEQKEALMSQISELKDIKLSSMEEKVSNILIALNRQTEALNEVTSQLSYAAKLNFGKPTPSPAATFSRGDEKPRPEIKLSGYERFLMFNKYMEEVQKSAWDSIVKNEGEEFNISCNRNLKYKFTYKITGNIVEFFIQSTFSDPYRGTNDVSEKTEKYTKQEILLNIPNIHMVRKVVTKDGKPSNEYENTDFYPILALLNDDRIYRTSSLKTHLDKMSDSDLIRIMNGLK